MTRTRVNCKRIIYCLWAVLVGPALGQTGSGAADEPKCGGTPASESQRWAARNLATVADASLASPLEAVCEQSGDRRQVVARAQAKVDSISYTTLAAPKAARKAYASAGKELSGRNGNPTKAVEQLEKAVALYPGFAQAWNRLGETLFSLGRPVQAREAFDRALAADPKYPQPYASLAYLELSVQRFAEASVLIDRALRLDPNLTEAHLYQAILAYGSGRTEFAKQLVRTLLDDEPRARPVLGKMLAKEGDFRSATIQYREFLKRHPTSRTADRVRRELAEWHEKGLIE